MKQLILIICAIVPLLSWAQNDAKYLEPLPVVDGKITFTDQISAPTLSQQELYDKMYKWADERFKPDDKMKARIVYTDEKDGLIVVMGEEYIVFKSSALSIDRSRIYYQMNIKCSPEKVDFTMSKIKYWYNEERDGGEKFTAENWISDNNCLNKSKTKLLPISGKFRCKTIDLKDELIALMQNNIGNLLLANNNNATSNTTAATVSAKKQEEKTITAPVNAVSTKSNVPAGNKTKQTIADNSSNREAIIASANRITLTSGNEEQFEIGKECWGGIGKLFGKDVTFCLIDTQKTMANMLLSQNDKYKISFFVSGKNEPALVIKCKKMSVQSINGEEANKMNERNNASRKYNMYVGEIE